MFPPADPVLPRRAPTPADLVLLALLLGMALFVSFRPLAAASPSVLWVHSAAGSFQLDTRLDGEIPIHGPAGETRLRIAHGRVWIVQSPCTLHLCQRMGPLEGGWGSLVCVPNEVVVCFAAEHDDVDGVTR